MTETQYLQELSTQFDLPLEEMQIAYDYAWWVQALIRQHELLYTRFKHSFDEHSRLVGNLGHNFTQYILRYIELTGECPATPKFPKLPLKYYHCSSCMEKDPGKGCPRPGKFTRFIFGEL